MATVEAAHNKARLWRRCLVPALLLSLLAVGVVVVGFRRGSIVGGSPGFWRDV